MCSLDFILGLAENLTRAALDLQVNTATYQVPQEDTVNWELVNFPVNFFNLNLHI